MTQICSATSHSTTSDIRTENFSFSESYGMMYSCARLCDSFFLSV